MKELNKKGFTLVELLAVIVILALLIVVATRAIGSIQKNSKMSLLESESKKILTQSREDLDLYKLTNDTTAKFTYDTVSPYIIHERPSSTYKLEDGEYVIFIRLDKHEIKEACISDKDGNYIVGPIKSDYSFDTSKKDGSGCVCSTAKYDGLKKISDTNQACNP